MLKTELVFVRHGQTRSNLEGLLHGRTDAVLNSYGLWQAARVAERLRQFGQLHSIHSSPLSRALITARTISRRISADVVTHDDLVEFHFGDFEGFTIDQIRRSHPEIYGHMFDFADREFRFPNGESRGEFHERTIAAVKRIVDEHRGNRLVVVAHEGVIASAVTQLTDRDPNDWTQLRFDNCSITTVELNGSAVAEIMCWNDTLHLLEQEVDS